MPKRNDTGRFGGVSVCGHCGCVFRKGKSLIKHIKKKHANDIVATTPYDSKINSKVVLINV